MQPNLETLAGPLMADPILARRGRHLDVDLLLEIGATTWLLTLRAGRLLEVRRGPFVLPSYTKRAPIGHILNHHMKPIVRGRGRDEVHTTNPHVFTTSHGTQDMEGRLIPPHAGHNIHGESCHNVMRINHYWAKSWEYFKTKKQVRGSTADRPPGAPGADIPDDFWHQQNFNDEDDTMMVDRFWPRVQEQIKQLKEKIQ